MRIWVFAPSGSGGKREGLIPWISPTAIQVFPFGEAFWIVVIIHHSSIHHSLFQKTLVLFLCPAALHPEICAAVVRFGVAFALKCTVNL
jgi:hypothetical protein